MADGAPDRRVQRTRSALMEALVDLIVEKGYDRTTVQDILERANVGRSTFYEHFANKNDLLLGGWTLFQLELPEEAEDAEGLPLPEVTQIFAHTGESHALYRSLVASGTDHMVFEVARDDLQTSLERILDGLRDGGRTLPDEPAVLARFLAGGLIGMLRHWLDTGMVGAPEEMNARFQRLARSGMGEGAGPR